MRRLGNFTSVLIILFLNTTPVFTQNILTLHPVFAEADAVIEDQIEGTWRTDVFGIDTLLIRRIGDNFYHVYLPYQSSSPMYEAVITKIDSIVILDLFPLIPESALDALPKENLVKTHTIYRVSIQRDTLRLAGMSYPWFFTNVVQKKIDVDYTWSDVNPLLIGSTQEIREYLFANESDSNFFEQDAVLSRISLNETHPKVQTEDHSILMSDRTTIAPVSSHCIPSFPMTDGWFGGDGELSVPLSPYETLWIFGDTFVGEDDLRSRETAKMIANTVAVSTCSPGEEFDIKYYWRHADISRPEPIVQTFTKRYKFWPLDAFMVGNDLYMVLGKIGSRPGAAPGEIFNWTHLGLALAKIPEPLLTTPDRWEIQLFPWSDVFGRQEWLLGVVEGSYLYFFVAGDKQKKWMARLPINSIEQPDGYIEQLGDNGVWKVNVPNEERKVLFTGDVGNSLSYYQDLKKWIMVLGPGFITNKIRIRTSNELTGPWSPEILVYECPEQTPGSTVYDKDNFCYGGKAHIQYYDGENNTLLITYDSNVSDYLKLISSPDKYTARVIRIRIPDQQDER